MYSQPWVSRRGCRVVEPSADGGEVDGLQAAALVRSDQQRDGGVEVLAFGP
ncbi:hypothetical protein ACWFNE_12145 [Cellulomonas sp. NPDC055163]